MAKTYELISSYTVSSATTDVDFTSIPATYTDLVLRAKGGCNGISQAFPIIRVNSDTGTNYSSHAVISVGEGTASSATYAYTQTNNSTTYMFNHDGYWTNSGALNDFYVAEFISYANTNKWKTVVMQNSGRASGAYDGAYLAVGTWKSTSAITSINCRLTNSGTLRNFDVGTIFRLYGIKAA